MAPLAMASALAMAPLAPCKLEPAATHWTRGPSDKAGQDAGADAAALPGRAAFLRPKRAAAIVAESTIRAGRQQSRDAPDSSRSRASRPAASPARGSRSPRGASRAEPPRSQAAAPRGAASPRTRRAERAQSRGEVSMHLSEEDVDELMEALARIEREERRGQALAAKSYMAEIQRLAVEAAQKRELELQQIADTARQRAELSEDKRKRQEARQQEEKDKDRRRSEAKRAGEAKQRLRPTLNPDADGWLSAESAPMTPPGSARPAGQSDELPPSSAAPQAAPDAMLPPPPPADLCLQQIHEQPPPHPVALDTGGDEQGQEGGACAEAAPEEGQAAPEEGWMQASPWRKPRPRLEVATPAAEAATPGKAGASGTAEALTPQTLRSLFVGPPDAASEQKPRSTPSPRVRPRAKAKASAMCATMFAMATRAKSRALAADHAAFLDLAAHPPGQTPPRTAEAKPGSDDASMSPPSAESGKGSSQQPGSSPAGGASPASPQAPRRLVGKRADPSVAGAPSAKHEQFSPARLALGGELEDAKAPVDKCHRVEEWMTDKVQQNLQALGKGWKPIPKETQERGKPVRRVYYAYEYAPGRNHVFYTFPAAFQFLDRGLVRKPKTIKLRRKRKVPLGRARAALGLLSKTHEDRWRCPSCDTWNEASQERCDNCLQASDSPANSGSEEV